MSPLPDRPAPSERPSASPTDCLVVRGPEAAAVPPPQAVLLAALLSARSDWPAEADWSAWSNSVWKDDNWSLISSWISRCTSGAVRSLLLSEDGRSPVEGSKSLKGSATGSVPGWTSDIYEARSRCSTGTGLRIETCEKGHLVAKLSVLDHAPLSLADPDGGQEAKGTDSGRAACSPSRHVRYLDWRRDQWACSVWKELKATLRWSNKLTTPYLDRDWLTDLARTRCGTAGARLRR